MEGAPQPPYGERAWFATGSTARAVLKHVWNCFFKIAPTQVEATCKGLRIHFQIRDPRRIAGVTNMALGFQNVSSPTWPCFCPLARSRVSCVIAPRPIDNILVVALSEPTERPEDANCGVWAETSRFLRVGWSAVFAGWTHLVEAHICAISQLGRHGAQLLCKLPLGSVECQFEDLCDACSKFGVLLIRASFNLSGNSSDSYFLHLRFEWCKKKNFGTWGDFSFRNVVVSWSEEFCFSANLNTCGAGSEQPGEPSNRGTRLSV